MVPTPVFGASIALPTQGAIPKAADVGVSSEMAGALGFEDEYAEFHLGGQANLAAQFELAIKGSLKPLKIPVTAGMAIAFSYPPYEYPKGFEFGIPFALDAKTSLNQISVADEHFQHNTQMLAALYEGVSHLETADIHHHLSGAFASTSDELRTTNQHAMHTALNVDKHKGALLEHAVAVNSKGRDEGSPIDIEIGGSAEFELCLLFPCQGQ